MPVNLQPISPPHRPLAELFRLSPLVLALLMPQAQAASTDIATSPLETSAASLVKPNIMYVLDDSGSMDSDYMPDWANSSNSTLVRNAGYNGIYYNPAITYTPPMKYDGTSYNSMTSANTSAWTSVPFDGFGVQTPTSVGTNSFTNSSSGTNQDLSGNINYYTFTAGEYCSTPNQTSCNTQSAPSTSYPYPAYLRWCTTSALTTCQAVRIDTAPTGGVKYDQPRYPGVTNSTITTTAATAQVTITGSSNTSISGITVNGIQIMSTGSGTSSSPSTLAGYVVTLINNCTTTATGSCDIAGYSASNSSGVITITAPKSAGAITFTPVVTKSGSNGTAVTAFSGYSGVPGTNTLTVIQSTTTSYSYPGTSAKASTRTDCAGTTCTYAEEITNYANYWAYYRMRMQMTKSSASIAFNGLSTSYRLGYMSINNNTGSDYLNISDLTTGSTGQKQAWYAKFLAAKTGSSTPLRTALSNAGRVYAKKLATTYRGSTVTDPMQYSCQKNFTILSTDGYWNESSNPNQMDGSTDIGDQDSDSSVSRPYFDGNATDNTLADVAYYYYNTDLRDSSLSNATGALGTDVASNGTSPQRMITYTLGLGASGYMLFQSNYASATSGDYYSVAQGSTATSTVCTWQTTTSGACNWPIPVNNTQTTIDDLWHAAVNGRGLYRSATNSTDVQAALAAMLADVDAQTSSSAAATTNGANLSISGNYEFSTTFRSVDWYGELKAYAVDPTAGTIATTSLWSAQSLLDTQAYTARNIYTYNPTTGARINFDWASLNSTQKAYFQTTAITSKLSQFCTTGTACLPSGSQVDSTTAGPTTGAGGINLVNYLRGDRSNEGTDSTAYYRQRTHVLGDIVNSQPSFVKKPEFAYTDTGYATYVTTQSTRQGMVYVGANDGMLHAFNADTGAEVWSYIPSTLLPNLPILASKTYSSNHTYFVDGSPHTGDVYFGSAWHTMLVGGFGSGGRGFYALDITTPSNPTVLWEFSYDTSLTTGYVTDSSLGYSFGTPQFTKLTDGTWVVLLTAGYNNTSPGTGTGILYVLNAQTGAIIKKIDTGVGSSTGTLPTGCAAQPCPAGMTQIRTWVAHTQVNNTAPRVYAGDVFGNLWRFDISTITGTGSNTSNGSVQLLATLSDGTNRQPITSRPELGTVNGKNVVFVGTGKFLGVSDMSTTSTQSLYAIKDTLATSSSAIYSSPRSSTCGGSTTTGCFVKQTLTDTSGVRTATNNSVNFNTQSGWFVDLPESGERISTDPNLQLGTLVVTSNIPSATGSACAVAGTSYNNYFNYATGSNIYSISSVGSVNTALASSPVLLRTTSGTVKAIINLSDGTQLSATVPVGDSTVVTRRVSWRELINAK